MLHAVNYAQLLLPDFSLILLGYLICRYTLLNRPVWQSVELLVYYLLFPTLLFQSILKSPIQIHEASSLIGATVLMGALAIAMSYCLPLLPVVGKRINRRDHAASAQVGFRFNSYIMLALSERLIGTQGLLMMAVVIGICVPLFNIAAVWPMSRGSNRGFIGELVRNPLIVATVVGLACNFMGLSIPKLVEPIFTRIGSASLALGLMAAGAGLQFGELQRNKVLTVSLLSIRHLILPLLAFGLARAFRLDPAQTTVLILFSASPTAPSAFVLAARMGFNGPYVAGLVTLSTMLGVLSLPFALGLLQ
ncbi:AEC family transporter [Diaphorobacter aerolatus]|uniref:AEC family transporter n=1 Tax=Diaphorobacter aerolatus TaxID=1288495 RepID=A0A7H0GIG6_9BURK|nr:AEC family transporter [Diaphorobacter aerolatus]QNP48082.1 AEC family transporter [Diaphorobacter aerolatus]